MMRSLVYRLVNECMTCLSDHVLTRESSGALRRKDADRRCDPVVGTVVAVPIPIRAARSSGVRPLRYRDSSAGDPADAQPRD